MTICWSNKPGWSTRVLDDNNPEQAEIKKLKLCTHFLSKEMITKLEKSAQIAQFGVFYDAVTGLHRAPKIEDLDSDKIEVDDYRIFMRFRH